MGLPDSKGQAQETEQEFSKKTKTETVSSSKLGREKEGRQYLSSNHYPTSISSSGKCLTFLQNRFRFISSLLLQPPSQEIASATVRTVVRKSQTTLKLVTTNGRVAIRSLRTPSPSPAKAYSPCISVFRPH